MMILHPLVVVGTLLLGSGYGQDVVNYCQANYCQPELKNVGCNPPSPAGGPACLGKFTHSVDLASANGYGKQIILSQHNKLRSLIASGKLAEFQPAIRMPTLVWDEELARQAGHNVRSCVFAHDECRNTPLFRYVGQNIAKTITSGTSLQIDQLILESVQAWWSEFNVTTQAQLDRYPRETSDSRPIGHFTQMINDRAWKIGCAIQTWIERNMNNTFYMVCNYSFSNHEDQPVYQRGPRASRCNTGENPDYPGLCSTKERIFSTPTAITN